jgi:hypothetical protein
VDRENAWNETDKILPEKDGVYEICNYPEEENKVFFGTTATAFYDGYGFKCGVYRYPRYWRIPRMTEPKRYGKVEE